VGHQAIAVEVGKTILWARPGADPGECVGIPAGPADDSGPLNRREQFRVNQPSTICMLPSSTGKSIHSPTGKSVPSSTGKSVPASTIKPVESPATASPTCVPSPTGKVRDSHESYLQKATYYSCANNGTQTEYLESSVNLSMRIVAGTWTSGKQTFTGAKPYTGDTAEDDVYDISIVSVDKCTPEATTGTFSVGYNLAQPVRDATITCNTLTYDAWKSCKCCPSSPTNCHLFCNSHMNE